jgi:hypothetical protein
LKKGDLGGFVRSIFAVKPAVPPKDQNQGYRPAAMVPRADRQPQACLIIPPERSLIFTIFLK